MGRSLQQSLLVVGITIVAVLAERYGMAKLGIVLPQWAYLALAALIGLLVSIIVQRAKPRA